ncbi:hypothetical protein FA95DRAFT_1480580, partial [Auriscalpium vulgare]
EELLRTSEHNVLIETLQAGKLGLPVAAEPQHLVHVDGADDGATILHPSVLILTKLKRWCHSHESTWPKAVTKCRSDEKDIEFMIYWLLEQGLTIRFDLYQGKERPELLKFVKTYRDKFIENEDLIKTLQSIVEPPDWSALDE